MATNGRVKKKSRASSAARSAKAAKASGVSTTGARAKGRSEKGRRTDPRAKAVVLLSGGNPQIAKADGPEPVEAYITALPGWKSALGKRIDRVIERALPQVKKAVKWNSPIYGVDGQSWFLGMHAFTRYLKLAFFRGAVLRPPPPGTSKDPNTRYLDLHEHDTLDEAQLERWVKQAAALPGWRPGAK
jgi:hypothetical protein